MYFNKGQKNSIKHADRIRATDVGQTCFLAAFHKSSTCGILWISVNGNPSGSTFWPSFGSGSSASGWNCGFWGAPQGLDRIGSWIRTLTDTAILNMGLDHRRNMKKPTKEKSKEKAHPSSVFCFKTFPSGSWGWLCWSFSVPSSTHTICRDWGHNTFFCANMKRTCQVSKVDGKNSSLFSVCVYSYSGSGQPKWT